MEGEARGNKPRSKDSKRKERSLYLIICLAKHRDCSGLQKEEKKEKRNPLRFVYLSHYVHFSITGGQMPSLLVTKGHVTISGLNSLFRWMAEFLSWS